MKRPVYIERKGDTWMVKYTHRRPRGRYCAATFYAVDFSEEYVRSWIKSRHDITLEEKGK